jgi:subtilisin
MGRSISWRVVGALLLLLVAAPAAFGGGASTASASQEPLNVFIMFDRPPGLAEQLLIAKAGGRVTETYSVVPAVSAQVPPSALIMIIRTRGVITVEPHVQVYADDFSSELNNVWGVRRVGGAELHPAGKTGAGVRVAILDTGIAPHADLTYDPSCSSGTSYGTINDGQGHGTHVAGTIAAKRNGTGVVGVAPGATLCIFKVLGNDGSGSSANILSALNWISTFNAANPSNPIRVTNNSYGASTSLGSTVQAAFDRLANEGVLHIASAGNSGPPTSSNPNPCGYPARYASVVAVAATTSTDTLASFSSVCAEVELAAPGVGILSTVRTGGYEAWSGTSMASPHVAGSAAVVWAADTTKTAAQVRNLLTSTALDLGTAGRDSSFGFGLVQPVAALNALTSGGSGGTPTPPPNGMTVSSITYSVKNGSCACRDLVVHIVVRDANGNPVSGASVRATLTRQQGGSWTSTGTTNSNGVRSFTLSRAPTGTYSTAILSATKTGLTWDGVTPPNSYTKTR